MNNESIYKEMGQAIIDLDEEKAIELANKAINEKMDLIEVIEKGYGDGIRQVGELWEEGEFFLP
ncbi:MAG: B12-binding domain-containing protein, partial [Promethearchaeota archaeon]